MCTYLLVYEKQTNCRDFITKIINKSNILVDCNFICYTKTTYYLPPLDGVNIPQEISGNVLRNVGLGIIIAVLITTGVLTITYGYK